MTQSRRGFFGSVLAILAWLVAPFQSRSEDPASAAATGAAIPPDDGEHLLIGPRRAPVTIKVGRHNNSSRMAVKREEGKNHPKTKSFFRQTDYDKENQLRHDAHKWETTLHRRQTFQPASLKDPFFDVHYQTRLAGRAVQSADKIHYALVITVSAPKMPNLYDRIVQRYRTQLQPLRPIIAVPVRV